MKNRMLSGAKLVAVLLLFSASVTAEMAKGPVYRPRDPNAPAVRVDGRTRGADDVLLSLTVLAPEHVGLTTQEQPCLYWYQSKAADNVFELTISQNKKPEPLLEVTVKANGKDAIRRFCLADHGVKLEKDVEYRWSVAMVLDPKNRSKDIIASGGLKRIEAPESLGKRLGAAKNTELAFIYADEGFWYDALQALSDEIDQYPNNKKLHEQRAIFFMQVGLPEAARLEMQKSSVDPVTAPKH